MIDNIQGSGPRGARPPQTPPASRPPQSEPAPAGPSAGAPDLRARLGSVAARLEELMRDLTSARARGGDAAAKESTLRREISAAQVAFQNILSTDISGDADAADLTGEAAVAHALRPGNVLQLLE